MALQADQRQGGGGAKALKPTRAMRARVHTPTPRDDLRRDDVLTKRAKGCHEINYATIESQRMAFCQGVRCRMLFFTGCPLRRAREFPLDS